jgi:hypothetical protein
VNRFESLIHVESGVAEQSNFRPMPLFEMSGAEFIAFIGILASIERLVEASGRLVKRAVGFYRDSKELPKTVEELQTVGFASQL